jgi:hypothetical protein
MHTEPDALTGTNTPRRRDEGSALPLVLVMMVLGALVVIPMLTYTVTVLRANTVVVESNREREAAEANVRIALLDPLTLFAECDGGAVDVDLMVDTVIADPELTGTTRCERVSEVSALNALGFPTPNGITATELGTAVPDALTGDRTATPAGTPPVDWWFASARAAAESDTIWLPDLPTFPSAVARPATPYSMPATFDCKVFLPGYYDQSLVLDPATLGTNRVYFASGVYYFERDVTVTGDIDVVAGYGVEGFDGSECADDLQVSGNLISGPATYGIDGVGATFVFGDAGHLVVENAATGAGPKLRFNQRYGDVDGGGRISIMSVNGVNADLAEPQFVVDGVVAVPRSNVVHDDVTVAIGQNGQNYVPSTDTYTSAARAPEAPVIVSADVYTATVGPPRRGGVLLTWNDVTGQDANGALVTDYTVTVDALPANVCPATSIYAPAAGQLACFVDNLPTSGTVRLNVTATNSAGTSTATEQTVTMAASAPLRDVPSALDTASLDVLTYIDGLHVDWPAAAHNGSVITGHDVLVERVYEYTETPVAEPPVAIQVVDGTWACAPRAGTWLPVATECIVRGPGTLDTTPGVAPNGGTYVGYRVTVTALNGIGPGPASALSVWITEPGVVDAPSDPAPPVRSFVPRTPDPIVDLRLDGAASATVSIPGYVSVPMGRISVQNTPGHNVRINGGILASTIDVIDGRAGPADAVRPSSLPIGYVNDIVLQRTVRVTSTVGRTTAVAVVQINETGELAVNSWTVR